MCCGSASLWCRPSSGSPFSRWCGSDLSLWYGFWSVLRIRIRDRVPFWPLDPGSGMGRKSASGSGIRDEQPGSYFLELRNHFFVFFGLKYLHSLMRIRDPGWRQFGSGIREGKSRIRDPQHWFWSCFSLKWCESTKTCLQNRHGSIFSLHCELPQPSVCLHFEPPQLLILSLMQIQIRILLLTLMQLRIRNVPTNAVPTCRIRFILYHFANPA